MTRDERAKISYEARKIMRDKQRVCANCGSTENLDVHHIVPVSKGGITEESNLVYLCKSCHLKAHAQVMSGLKERVEIVFADMRAKKILSMAKALKIENSVIFDTVVNNINNLELTEEEQIRARIYSLSRAFGMKPQEFLDKCTEMISAF